MVSKYRLQLINTLIFLPEDKIHNRVTVSGRQYTHLLNVLKAQVGDTFKVGELNGQIGTGCITHIENDRLFLDVDLHDEPAPLLPLALVIALPRPQMIKRILQTVATLGVQDVHFIQTEKVEKNYWQSPTVADAAIFEQLHLGLEQGGSTLCPRVYKHPKWHAFINDILPSLKDTYTDAFVAHLTQTRSCPSFYGQHQHKALMFIGPEGGFSEAEISQLNRLDIQTVQLGERIMRVETAVTALITKLYY